MLFKPDEASDAAAFLPFDTHEDAIRALESVGYRDVSKVASFTPEQLCELVNAYTSQDNITVMDMTSTIPETPQAAYQALTVAGFTGTSACMKDQNAAFLMLRTQKNSPSFLFGTHWSMAQSLGREAADAHAHKSPTPGLYVLFRERQMYVPTKVCHASIDIVARLVAQELTQRDLLTCCICNESFVEHGPNACVTVGEMGIGPCSHMMHRDCAARHVQLTGRFGCPACESVVAALVPNSETPIVA